MKSLQSFCGIALYIFFSGILYAQAPDQLKFRHYGTEEGLADMLVRNIIQDQKGFIWLATGGGLFRFDGSRFKTFEHNPKDSTSLSNHEIYSLIEDQQGKIWVGTYRGGLNLYDPETETFRSWSFNENDPTSPLGNDIYSLAEDPEGNIWIGTNRGLGRIERKTMSHSSFKRSEKDNLLNDYLIYRLAFDQQGKLWLGTYGAGVVVYDPETGQTTSLDKMVGVGYSFTSKLVSALKIDDDGNIWIGTIRDGLIMYNPTNRSIKQWVKEPGNPNSISDNIVFDIDIDKSGNVWAGTGSGLNYLNKDKGLFISFLESESDPSAISGNIIYSVFNDRDNNLWVGTQRNGLNLHFDGLELFNNYTHKINIPGTLSNAHVFSLFEDSKGTLWAGTEDGLLNELIPESNLFNTWQREQNTSSRRHHSKRNTIESIIEDDEQNLWFATDNGLVKYSPQSKFHEVFSKNSSPSLPFTSNIFHSILQGRGDSLWLGTYGGGLNLFNKRTKEVTSWVYEENKLDRTVCDNMIRCIIEDNNGDLWLGTDAGLSQFNLTTGHFEHFYPDIHDHYSISSYIINCLFQDEEGIIWIGTYNGLNKYNPETGKFESFQTNEFLSKNNINSIVADDSGYLWLGTNKGLHRFDKRTGQTTIYDKSDGLPDNQFNKAAGKGRDGSLFFGTTNGFVKFHPDKISDNTTPPAVIISDFLLFNKSVEISDTSILTKSIESTRNITLRYSDYIFAFEFTALNYQLPEKSRYRYILEGFNNEWIETGHQDRKAVFTNVPDGQYVFRVIASNDDGYWNEEGAAINITVLPPWWKTWWAYTFMGLAVIGVLFTFYAFKVSMYKKQQIKLKEMVDERTLKITEQKNMLMEINRQKDELVKIVAHDLRSPLNKVKGLIEIINLSGKLNKDQAESMNLIHNVLDHGNSLTNDLLDLYSLEQDKVETKLSQIEVSNFLKEICKGQEQELKKKEQKIISRFGPENFTFTTDPNLLTRILDNLLSNARKFSANNKEIQLSAHKENGLILFKVTDQGPGISENDRKNMFKKFSTLSARPTAGESSHGLGLSIVHTLTKQLGGTIQVNSRPGEGAEFVVTLQGK
ncbi:MAG: ATP-binding protein [Cyclobacteriaceae bacterium]|nr:ATP-binding protein [Cyclobacteriaceae bacterium]